MRVTFFLVDEFEFNAKTYTAKILRNSKCIDQEETKRAVLQKGGFGECAPVPFFVPSLRFLSPRSGFGVQEHLFWGAGTSAKTSHPCRVEGEMVS